jgi:thiamine biosynthesis lipoprotein
MMRDTRLLMGTPITVEIIDHAPDRLIDDVFAYFSAVDGRFSTFKPDSEISALNRGGLAVADTSAEMQEVLGLADRTKRETTAILRSVDAMGFWIRAASSRAGPSATPRVLSAVPARGTFLSMPAATSRPAARTPMAKSWKIGIRNPFNEREIIKAVTPEGRGIATSGTYVRQHIYDPRQPGRRIDDIVSLTVIGPDVLRPPAFPPPLSPWARPESTLSNSCPASRAMRSMPAASPPGRAALGHL